MDDLIAKFGVILIEAVTLIALTTVACKIIGELFETLREWIRT